jgi:Ran GTPase-activating protein (RanGAP) involved in mRNA processing and transport
MDVTETVSFAIPFTVRHQYLQHHNMPPKPQEHQQGEPEQDADEHHSRTSSKSSLSGREPLLFDNATLLSASGHLPSETSRSTLDGEFAVNTATEMDCDISLSIMNRPSRDVVLQRLSEALLRRSLTKVCGSDIYDPWCQDWCYLPYPSSRTITHLTHFLSLAAFIKLSSLAVISKIDLSQRGIRTSDARLINMALAQNASLTTLKLGYNDLGDDGLRTLANGIARHGALESLDLGFNNIGDNGCRALAEAITAQPMSLSRLRTLYLAGNVLGEDGALAIAKIVQHGSLEKLYLTGNRVGPDGVRAIAEAALELQLEKIHKVNINCVNSLQASRRGIKELFLGGTGLGGVGCQAIADLLGQSSTLQVLSLANCDLDNDSLSVLASSIKSNREQLPLESLQLSFNQISCKGVESLSNAIWGCRSLRELLLDNNQIGDRGAGQIAAVLASANRLETLNVGFNRIKAVGIKAIMRTVPESESLHSLSLSGNTVDASAARSIAYALAFNHSLLSLSLVNTSIQHEGQRHITAGIVSNSHIKLLQLNGFRIGPIVVTLGFPAALEHWSNDQILNFIHLMWDKSAELVAQQEHEAKPVFDTSRFFSKANPRDRAAPLDAAVVVDVAKKAYLELVTEGVDIFSKRPGNLHELSPLPGDNFIVESTRKVGENSYAESSLESHVQARSFVTSPELAGSETYVPDPQRKKRVIEWLCSNIQNLNKMAQQPFNSKELWALHQRYFTPVVNECGGSVNPSSETSNNQNGNPKLHASRVSRSNSTENPADMMNDSTDDTLMTQSSDPFILDSPQGIVSLPVLKRKVSYRFLGDAMVNSAPRMSNCVEMRGPETEQPISNGMVSMMIEGGPVGHSMPRKTKRARRNRTRISFLPRVKVKLDSYLDVCHEKALTMMRQLYFVERAILLGQLNSDVNSMPYSARMHLHGVLAMDAEMILVDMI